MRNGIIVCRLSLIKTDLLAFHVLRKFRDSAPLRGFEAISGCCVRLYFIFQKEGLCKITKYQYSINIATDPFRNPLQ